MIQTLLHVALGGAVGAAARYLTVIASVRVFGVGFPMGTLAVNVIGSFAMGVLVAVLTAKGGMRFAPFLLTGLLGGFTTFSAFSLDALTLWERGQANAAFAYIAGSVLLSLLAVFAGITIARGIFA